MPGREYKPDPVFSWLTGRPGVIAATSLLVLYLVAQFVPSQYGVVTKAVGTAGLLVALLAFLVIGDLYKRVISQQAESSEMRREIRLLRAGVERRVVAQFLETSEQMFEALNSLRNGCKRIRIMMIRDEAPVRFTEKGSVLLDQEGKPVYVKDSVASLTWFEGLPAWLAEDPERSFERLSCNSTPEMANYQEFVTRHFQDVLDREASARGRGEYTSRVLDFGGLSVCDLPPFLNVSIFDDEALVISFSGKLGERQHPHMKGVLLRSPEIVRFFVEEYYEPFRHYIVSKERLPVGEGVHTADPQLERTSSGGRPIV